MNGRHELKYYINAADYAQVRARLHIVANPDPNAGPDGHYSVRSLYFDNYSDKAVIEKLSGQSRREKFRLRLYNSDTSFIRLERKSKANMLAYKESAAITAEQCADLLAGRYGCLKQEGEPLLMEVYTKIHYQNLRPRNIVEYDREAYTYHAGNIRITFDTRIRTTNSTNGFLKPNLATIPATGGAIIMEIKYDGFIPCFIRDCLRVGGRNQTEFSKYLVARLV